MSPTIPLFTVAIDEATCRALRLTARANVQDGTRLPATPFSLVANYCYDHGSSTAHESHRHPATPRRGS